MKVKVEKTSFSTRELKDETHVRGMKEGILDQWETRPKRNIAQETQEERVVTNTTSPPKPLETRAKTKEQNIGSRARG